MLQLWSYLSELVSKSSVKIDREKDCFLKKHIWKCFIFGNYNLCDGLYYSKPPAYPSVGVSPARLPDRKRDKGEYMKSTSENGYPLQ